MVLRIEFVFIFLFLVGCLESQDWNGFDDTVIFKMNWPGDNANLLDTDAEILNVKTPNKEEYQCIIPSLKSKSASQVDDLSSNLTPLELLSPLFSQKVCSYRLESYWTYELCHGRFVRQYHEEREGKWVKIQEFFLGKWDAEKQKKLEESFANIDEDEEKLKYKKIEGVNVPYFEIEMTDGTICDLNNKPRVTKMQYVCFTYGKHEVYSFKETSTCEYEVIILSPLLCSHPKYRPVDSGENLINCLPVGNAPKKPRSMLAMEIESLKLRSQKLSVNKLGKDVVAVLSVEQVGQDGESRLKVELHPVVLDATKKPTLAGEGGSKLIQTNTLPPLHDTTPIKSFLDGESCLNGGTGWWKYEFCYGKTVIQYHVDKSGSRQSLLLGKFDMEDHLTWLQQNPHKKPKPKGPQRTFVSHFYSRGEICDKTGNPRETEVKLKCLENSSSPGQVSLYLLEPKICQYILSVESPLICDILDLADENGLINLPSFLNMKSYSEEVAEDERQNSEENDEELPTLKKSGDDPFI